MLLAETTTPTVSDAGILLKLLVSGDTVAGGPASAFAVSEEGGGPNCCKSSLVTSFCSGAATTGAALAVAELVSAAALPLEVASLLLSCVVVVSSWGATGTLPTAVLSETAGTPKSGVVSCEALISLEVSSEVASAPSTTWVLFSAVLASISPPSLPLVPALLGAATPSVSGIPPPFRPMK